MSDATGSDTRGKMVDQTGKPRAEPFDFWEPVIFTGEEIDAKIERLAGLERPESGFRSTSCGRASSRACSGTTRRR